MSDETKRSPLAEVYINNRKLRDQFEVILHGDSYPFPCKIKEKFIDPSKAVPDGYGQTVVEFHAKGFIAYHTGKVYIETHPEGYNFNVMDKLFEIN